MIVYMTLCKHHYEGWYSPTRYKRTVAYISVVRKLDCICSIKHSIIIGCFCAIAKFHSRLFFIPPLSIQGFGVAAKSTQECRHADATAIVAFHQADVGQYLRLENTL